MRGDIIEVFKLLKGFSKVNYKTWYESFASGRTRSHSYILINLEVDWIYERIF